MNFLCSLHWVVTCEFDKSPHAGEELSIKYGHTIQCDIVNCSKKTEACGQKSKIEWVHAVAGSWNKTHPINLEWIVYTDNRFDLTIVTTPCRTVRYDNKQVKRKRISLIKTILSIYTLNQIGVCALS